MDPDSLFTDVHTNLLATGHTTNTPPKLSGEEKTWFLGCSLTLDTRSRQLNMICKYIRDHASLCGVQGFVYLFPVTVNEKGEPTFRFTIKD